MIFLWLKAVHIAAVITWLGGLLMASLVVTVLATAPIPRMPQERRLLIAVTRWDRWVTTPAMAAAWLLGITLALQAGWLKAPWLGVKVLLVMALSALHGRLAGTLRRMKNDHSHSAPRSLRFAAGFTLIAALAIALLVVLKPF